MTLSAVGESQRPLKFEIVQVANRGISFRMKFRSKRRKSTLILLLILRYFVTLYTLAWRRSNTNVAKDCFIFS